VVIGDNEKPIKVIGYQQASATKDIVNFYSRESLLEVSIITPDQLTNLKDPYEYQYAIGFCLDMQMREQICNFIDNNNLNCLSYIHESAFILEDAKIGKGVFIGPFNVIQDSIIGDYCGIDCYCLVGHDSNLGRNSILHPGTMISGNVVVGNNCTFGLKSSVLNRISITDNVTISAYTNVTKSIDISGVYVGSIARRKNVL
jgi:UDP-3-O-[3-hydroxymyristoyl] glucosamine N-acyltransferase